MPRVPVRIVFVLLVCATLGAFLITQRLKRTEAVVNRVYVKPKHFSPNRDGVNEHTGISFRLRDGDHVTATVADDKGDAVRTLALDRYLSPGFYRFTWDGRTDAGARAPDGTYFLRVGLRRKGLAATAPKKIFLAARPPRPVVTSVSPAVLTPGVRGRSSALISFRGPDVEAPAFLVYRTGPGPDRLVARFSGRARQRNVRWDGRVFGGHPAPAGNYLVAVRVVNAAGTVGTGPPRLPPRRGETEGHPGIRVSYLSVDAPKGAVTGGQAVHLRVQAPSRRWRWVLRRADSGRVVRRGTGSGERLRLVPPAGAASLYLVELRAGGGARGHAYRTPLAVRSTGAAARQAPILVVLPILSWQAGNPVDSNQDGFADVLGPDHAVPLRRAFAEPGLPSGFIEVRALLGWARAQGLRYQLTTDLDLARGAGPGLRRFQGVVFPGSERYLTPGLGRRLVRYVRDGGHVASLGVDAFRRRVAVSPAAIVGTGRPRPRDVFGERLRAVRAPSTTAGSQGAAAAPFVVSADRGGLFARAGLAGGEAFGTFETAEELLAAPRGGSVRSTALYGGLASGRRPAFSLYRVGAGLLLRSGSAQWNANVDADPATGRIMREAWRLLSR